MTSPAAALVAEILSLQALGLDSADIAHTVVARELLGRGWPIADISRELRIPSDLVLGLLGPTLLHHKHTEVIP